MYTVKMISSEVKSSLCNLSSACLPFTRLSSFIQLLPKDLATSAIFMFVWPLSISKYFHNYYVH